MGKVSEKLRFEVFKRDSFKCQYCGAKAPDIILHVDHIDPVSKGGGNDILNLVTSCKGCNMGKGANKLSDDNIVFLQRDQIEEANERKNQITMIVNWRKGLQNIEEEKIDGIAFFMNEKIEGYSISESGRRDIKKWLKKYTFEEILDSIEESYNQYLKYDENGALTQESVSKSFNYVPRIAYHKKNGGMDENKKNALYIRGILKNRRLYFANDFLKIIEEAMVLGASFESLKNVAIESRNWTIFKESVLDFLAKYKGKNIQYMGYECFYDE